VDDLFGLGDDRWWERLLTRWERLPHGLRTAFLGGVCGVVIAGLLVVLNTWGQTPVG
jgi:tetrahydromethanopterin S-methyltransferase subunit F